MGWFGGLLTIGGLFFCGFLLLVVLVIALVFWFIKRQPDQQASATAPVPQIQPTIQRPNAAVDLGMPDPPAPGVSTPAPAAVVDPSVPDTPSPSPFMPPPAAPAPAAEPAPAAAPVAPVEPAAPAAPAPSTEATAPANETPGTGADV